jgi:TonB family protein
MPQLKDLEAGSIAAAASKSRGRFYTCLSAIAILGIAVLFLANSGGLGWHRAVPAASPSITAGLSLQAERRPGELLLTWDSQSEAIRNASRAVLEISDGAHRENIVMDQTQLRNGSFAYSPSTGDVVFKMDVTAGQSKVIESVRVLTAAPLPAAGKTQRDALQKKPGTPTANSSENAAAKEPPPADSEPSPKPQLISRIEPEYPDAARDAGAKGPVKVSATIGMDGKVKSVRPMSGDAVLFQPATEAVMQWLYHPAMRNGVPVEAETQIVLNFAAER